MTNKTTPDDVKDFQKRKVAWKFYGEDVNKLNRDIIAHNNGVIIVCHKCNKIDVHPIYHASDCNPEAEALRQEAQEYLWK
jgi:hypothetical protein